MGTRSGTAFSLALDRAIAASGLGLDRVRHRLAERGVQVSITTISYWRSGRSRPERPDSLRAVGILEDLFGLPGGALSELLGPRRPRGRNCHRDVLDGTSSTDRLSVHQTCLVGDDGVESGREVRELVRARRDGVTRTFLALPARAVPVITAESGFRLGGILELAGRGSLVAELILERTLDTGDTALLEYRLRYERPDLLTSCESRLSLPVKEFLLQVRFPAPVVPEACTGYYRPEGRERTAQRPLAVTPSGRAHLVELDAGPGVYGIRWA
ncbi:hypothetical protein [Amycolatopsis nigrescens]|uniref:hypothetical protein n=1 Tax=Amycolatopsis nigrescens TaxID=381445 RepID=UPI000376FF91|nr:hypothetical protein [Amycolatopsis nigrescens]